MITRSLGKGIVLISAAATFALPPARAGNWGAWRGPLQSGAAPEGNPPAEWSESNNVKWKVKIPGESTATPIVWGDRIFVVSAINTGRKAEQKSTVGQGAAAGFEVAQAQQDGNRPPGGGGGERRRGPGGPGGPGGGRGGMGGEKPTEIHQFIVACLERGSGKTLWQRTAREEVPHEGHHGRDGSFAPYSPVTDGQHVYAYFGSRGLYCYDFEGKLVWSQDYGDMNMKMGFGEGSSPVLYGDTIVMKWDHEGASFILAVDKRTGKELWRKPREEKTSWSTPAIAVYQGKPQVITTASEKVRAYDLGSGEQIWETSGLTANAIPSPIPADGVVYCMSGFRGAAARAIPLGNTGTLSESDFLWTFNKATPYVPSPLLYNGRLYFLSGNNGVLTCLDANTGKPFYSEERLPELREAYASPVAASGKVFLVGRDGSAVVLKDGEKLEKIATNRLEDRFDGSPAIAGNAFFLRGREHLYCIAE